MITWKETPDPEKTEFSENHLKIINTLMNLIERGESSFELIGANYPPQLVEFLFRIRNFILTCEKNRGRKIEGERRG